MSNMPSVSEELVCADRAQSRKNFRAAARDLFAAEKERVLAALPRSYRDAFGEMGFYDGHPVLVVDPYAAPPEPFRKQWLNQFKSVGF